MSVKSRVEAMTPEEKRELYVRGMMRPEAPSGTIIEVGSGAGRHLLNMAHSYPQAQKIIGFEPVRELRDELEMTPHMARRISIYDYGLGASTYRGTLQLIPEENRASNFTVGSEAVRVQIRDILEVWNELELEEVDLMIIGTDGAEYDIIKRMIDGNLHTKVREFMVQFPEDAPDAEAHYNELVGLIDATHDVYWRYPWVWESWVLRDRDYGNPAEVPAERESQIHNPEQEEAQGATGAPAEAPAEEPAEE